MKTEKSMELEQEGGFGISVQSLQPILQRHKAIEQQISGLAKSLPKEQMLPLSIFSSRLGMLEASCLYLRDTAGMSFNAIAGVLHRDYKTIWTSYTKARRKARKSKNR